MSAETHGSINSLYITVRLVRWLSVPDRSRRALEILYSSGRHQSKALSDTEVHDSAQLMAKAGQENAEVSGDEDEDEDVLESAHSGY